MKVLWKVLALWAAYTIGHWVGWGKRDMDGPGPFPSERGMGYE